ncbi:ParB/RepB/Spo0J family partition protein [Propioniciclava soli]|uniref:ParB/RepB/Spo0J family partition protein n=1 Tax=Propioniciclava soli TaxID=2775081 RepID=UPI001E4B6B89|nr:ParB N-terminal domain-containing protein [Propioniciclava soli]
MALPTRGIPDGTTLRTTRRSAGVLTSAVDGPRTVAVSEIAFNPNNPPRRRSQDIEALARSVASQGVLTPLLLCRAEEWLERFPDHADEVGDATWVALDGDRRLSAARLCSDTVQQVPYYERSIHDLDDTLVRLHTGTTALRLTPIEDAVQLQRLMAQHNWTQQEVAEAVAVSQSHVSKRLQLMTLPVAVQAAVEDGRITVKEALDLAATRRDLDGKSVRDDDLLDRVAALLDAAMAGATGNDEDVREDSEGENQTSLAELREIALRQRHQEASDEVARSRAKEFGAMFAEDPLEHIDDMFGHRIHATDQATLQRAARDHNLLVTPSTAGKDTGPQYWHLRPPQRTHEHENTQDRQRRDAKHAREARWVALSQAAAYSPSPELLRDVLIATMLTAAERLPDLNRLIHKLLKEHNWIKSDSSDWAGQLAGAEAPSQVAWAVALAHREARIRANERWTASDVDYIEVLMNVAQYAPTEWEKAQMDEVNS